MIEKPKRLTMGSYRFSDWSAPDPDDGLLDSALHTARYALTSLTQDEAYAILAAAEAYIHFVGHPAANKLIVDQLLAVRAAVRAQRKKDDQ